MSNAASPQRGAPEGLALLGCSALRAACFGGCSAWAGPADALVGAVPGLVLQMVLLPKLLTVSDLGDLVMLSFQVQALQPCTLGLGQEYRAPSAQVTVLLPHPGGHSLLAFPALCP